MKLGIANFEQEVSQLSLHQQAVLSIFGTEWKQLQFGKAGVCSIEKLQYMAFQYLTHCMDQLQVSS